ncbi:MAG: 4'-phosphopantetheinyl transferase superfamily protein [Lachnospiraceae bacterium]|nr:4'-phosphopantetheinyl transferase superfamily protein [Lachnospiraceae bacterium]
MENIVYDPSVFSEGRLQKIEKVKQEDDKQLSAAVELLLIYGIKQLDEEVALPLQIKEEESGNLLLESKVKVDGKEQPLYFNLSHSKEYAACVISDEPVGIDIECVKTRDVEHMDKILHEQEYLVLSFVTNPEEKKKYFYECWVTKESYLKNLGCGLVIRPGEFMVSEDKMETQRADLKKRYVHVYKSNEIENADWKFDNSYRMAICTKRKQEDAKVVLLTAENFNGLF